MQACRRQLFLISKEKRCIHIWLECIKEFGRRCKFCNFGNATTASFNQSLIKIFFMQLKNLLLLLLSGLLCVSTYSQRVKRKGVEAIDVTRNKGKAAAYAGPVFKVEQLTGKWQETGREIKSIGLMRIKDTLMLNFTEPGKVITREGNQGNMSGEAAIDKPGNILIAAADYYSIVSADSNQLVLDDEDGCTHTFTKTKQFAYETYGRIAVNADTYTVPVSFKFASIMGRWSVYRRKAKPGAAYPPVNMIQYLFITQKKDDSNGGGEITFYQNEKTTAQACSISIADKCLAIKAGATEWLLPVYKADGKELVFGNPETLLYYAKPL